MIKNVGIACTSLSICCMFLVTGCSIQSKPVVIDATTAKAAINQYFMDKHDASSASNFTLQTNVGNYISVSTSPAGGGNYEQGAYLFYVSGKQARLIQKFSLAGEVNLIQSSRIVPGTSAIVAIDEGSEDHSTGSYKGPYSGDLYGGQPVTMVAILNQKNSALIWSSPVFPGTAEIVSLDGGKKQGLAVHMVGVQPGTDPNGYDLGAAFTRQPRIYQWLASQHTMDIGSIGVHQSYTPNSSNFMSNLGFNGKGILIGQTGNFGQGGYEEQSSGSIYGYNFEEPYIPSNSVLMSVNEHETSNIASFRLYTEDIPFGEYGNAKIWSSSGTTQIYRLESIPEPISSAEQFLQAITDNTE